MKKFWAVVAIIFMLVPAGSTAVNAMSITQTIHLSGIVPPMRFIVVNAQGNITEITSNTPENVTPRVYRYSYVKGVELPLTEPILKDYETKIIGVDMHSTDLHFASSSPQVTAKTKQSSIFAAFSNISWLRLPSLF